MALPGKKYFKGRIYRGLEAHHYVIWDGVHDYQNMPPPGVMMAEFPPGPGDGAQRANALFIGLATATPRPHMSCPPRFSAG